MRSRRQEARHAGLGEHVTPTTAGLLAWWFDPGRASARAGLAFNEAQQRAIVDTITRHETECRQHRVAPPRHRVNLVDEADRIPVLLALMLWQLLNHAAARAAGEHDPRFTRHFVLITPDHESRARLLEALHGQPLAGTDNARDFGTAELVRLADLLAPEEHRDPVYAVMCSSACNGAAIEPTSQGDDWIVITNLPLPSRAALAHLPQLMVFAHEAPAAGAGQQDTAAQRRKRLRRIVSLHGKPCMEVVFCGPVDSAC